MNGTDQSPFKYGRKYKGPVKWVAPMYGAGVADMFCPRCASTDLESLDGTDTRFRCRECGRMFNLVLEPENKERRYVIKHDGDTVCRNLTADRVNNYAFDTVFGCEDAGHMYWLGCEYYGEPMMRQYALDDERPAYTDPRSILGYDIPSVEINHLTEKGYIGGMEVGDEIFVPDTRVSIIRTRNSKTRKGKRWLR